MRCVVLCLFSLIKVDNLHDAAKFLALFTYEDPAEIARAESNRIKYTYLVVDSEMRRPHP